MESTPQQDIEAALLNIVKHRYPSANRVFDMSPDIFSFAQHRVLFELFSETQRERGSWDDNLLRSRFRDKGGDIAVYDNVATASAIPTNVDLYIDELIKSAKERKLNHYLLSNDSHDDPIATLKNAIFELEKLEGMRQPRVRGASIDEVAENFRNAPIRPRLSCGLKTIDELLGGIRPEEMTALGGPPGTGKALSLETVIPVPQGFTTMENISIGDKVFDENGNICNVIAVTPVMNDRPCYRMTFSDGTQVICDANHQWLTRDNTARQSANDAKKNGRDALRPIKKYGTDQSHKRTYPHPVTTEYISNTLRIRDTERVNHSVAMAQEVVLPYVELPIDPYVLGCWLGDGHTNSGYITGIDEQIFQNIRNAGYAVDQMPRSISYKISGLSKELQQLGVLGNKHIPQIYLRASIDQRLSLLQGLMDTDGTCSKRDSRCEFTSTRKVLAEHTKELACSLGIKATIKEGIATLYGKDCGPRYRVCFTTDKKVFRLPRKLALLPDKLRDTQNWRYIVSCERVESVPVRCIEVDSPSHLYLCTASFVPTHNSSIAATLAYHIAVNGGHSIFFSKEMLESRIYSRLLARLSGTDVGLYEAWKAGEVQIDEHTMARIERVMQEMDAVGNRFTFFDLEDSPVINPQEIMAEVKAQNTILAPTGKRVDFIVVDYMQILDFEQARNQNMADALSDLAMGLRSIALQEHCHIFVLSSVNRAMGKSMQLEAFRGGGVDFNTDNALLMVNRNDLDFSSLGPEWQGERPFYQPIMIHCAKARNAQTDGDGYLAFSGRHQYFRDMHPNEKELFKVLLEEEGNGGRRGTP